jgi:hypothetical protein
MTGRTMIDRRTFTFVSLFMVVSRCFAQEKTPTRQMVKGEGSGIRMFSSEDLYRIEYLQERKVIIGNQKLNKIFILDLNSKTYTEKPYQHWATSARLTITTTKRPSKPEPQPYPFVPFDPSLFEIPAGFVKSK